MAVPHSYHIVLPNDVDVFCSCEEAFKAINTTLQDKGMVRTDVTSIAYTWEPKRAPANPICNLPLQIIKPNPEWKVFPQDIVNSFDFSVSRAVLMSKVHVLGDPEIGCKDARILRLSDPLRSLKRVVKYAQRGVVFDEWELHKLFLAYGEMSEERKTKMKEDVLATRFPDEDDYAWYSEDDYFEGE
jgi:hypothetical protein